jgi:hypothetical protein
MEKLPYPRRQRYGHTLRGKRLRGMQRRLRLGSGGKQQREFLGDCRPIAEDDCRYVVIASVDDGKPGKILQVQATD